MKLITQNLFLFFEENDDEKDISSSLVHLYMNRFVIAEEDQTEIIGIYNLAQTNEYTPPIEFHSQEPFDEKTLEKTQFWKENRTKMKHDKSLFGELGSKISKSNDDLISEILKSAIKELDFELESNDNIQCLDQKLAEFSKEKSIFDNSLNHFIIGSSFYVNSSRRRRNFISKIMQNWIHEFYRPFHFSVSEYFRELDWEFDYENIGSEERLYIQNIDRLRELEKRLRCRSYGLDNDGFNIQTLITMLRGSHRNLLTTEQLQIAHISSEIESDLVNDDLEEFQKFTMDQSMIQPMEQAQELRLDEFRCLSFYKEPTDPELDKLKQFQYEIDFKKQNWKTQKSVEALLPLIAQTDPGYQYLQCDCQRYTLSISNQYDYSHLKRNRQISNTEEKQMEKFTWLKRLLSENFIVRMIKRYNLVFPIAFSFFIYFLRYKLNAK